MKKKIFSLLVLIIGLFGIIMLLSQGNVNSLSNAVIEIEGFDSIPIGMAIFCELFVSIHMSVFVLFPIASIINRNKHIKIFIILFCLRLVILIIGDILNPTIMMLVDFMSVFFGAFIIVPVLGFIKGAKYKGKLAYHEYVDVDSRDLIEVGYSDIELLKRVLIELYLDVKQAFSNRDRKKLIELCSKHKYLLYKNELELLEKVNEKKMYGQFDIVEVKVHDVTKDSKGITISMILKIKNLEYIVDQYNKVVDGSDKFSNEKIVDLMFFKSFQHDKVDECPNCGSPVTKDSLEFCSYCGTELNFNIGEFVLENEKIIEE